MESFHAPPPKNCIKWLHMQFHLKMHCKNYCYETFQNPLPNSWHYIGWRTSEEVHQGSLCSRCTSDRCFEYFSGEYRGVWHQQSGRLQVRAAWRPAYSLGKKDSIAAKSPDNTLLQTVLAEVYVGLTDDEALRLASRHNTNSHFIHKLIHRDYTIM